ncbi:hypothetical protein BDW22DRAFT_1147716 [Trametopsis cervina]|nr:hypothetical protein BDW22DRAFT_1147716 [Trametopsis cervina]
MEASFAQNSDRYRRSGFSASTFASSYLRTAGGLERALSLLENDICNPTVDTVDIVKELCSKVGLFEFAVSHLSESTFFELLEALNRGFSNIDFPSYQTSVSKIVVHRISEFFSSINIPISDIDTACRIRRQNVIAASRSLDDILSTMYDAAQGSADERSLDVSAVDWPNTLVTKLSSELRTYLADYMKILRDLRLETVIRNEYLPPVVRTVAPVYNTPLFLSMRKTAVLTEMVDGYGHLRILLSSRSIRDLSHAQAKPKLFSSVLDTLRLLSIEETQSISIRTLADENGCVILAARVSNKCFIVYCTDNVPSLSHEGTDTALRIFGVYNISALQSQFWTTVASSITDRREREQTTDGHRPHAIAPAARKTPVRVVEHARSLVTVMKFVDLSKNVLQSIVNGLDIHQMMVPSPEEQRVIDHAGSCYILGRSGTGKTIVIITKMLMTECTWGLYFQTERKPRQVFVTRSQHLATNVKEQFFDMLLTMLWGPEQNSSAPRPTALLDAEEELRWNTAVPQRLGQLQDDNFPLFVSFERLCSLVVNEILFRSTDIPGWTPLFRSATLTYERFLGKYWPKLRTKNIDPFVLFSEFIGTIKGSEGSLHAGYLSRETYVGHSKERAIVYDLFERYRKLKQQAHEYDIADRTHDILRELSECDRHIMVETLGNHLDPISKSIDFLYVDEAQDNLIIDLRLLRLLRSHSGESVWAGDTAQTIFAGSSFTFNELKASMWRIEDELHDAPAGSPDPKFFQLSVNHRSQQGILSCSQTVLDCMFQFWPASLDKALKEPPVSGGQPPLFHNFNGDRGLLQSLIQSERNPSAVEFGAEQCIIVRDEATRQDLRPLLHRTAQILTLYESKGLEFDDVLLYKFFGDSIVNSTQWRHLAEHIQKNMGPNEDAEFFVLSHELKSLYVAITRARNNLWIIDSSEKACAMEYIWAMQNQISVQSQSPDLSDFAKASTKASWEQKGDIYFGRYYYKLATRAYANAGLTHKADMAEAYHLREVAKSSDTPDKWKKAAVAFQQLAGADSTQDRQPYHRISGECFLRIPDKESAAKAFFNGCYFTLAIQTYRSIADFDRVVELLPYQEIDTDTSTQMRYASQLFYFLRRKIRNAVGLFNSELEAHQFLHVHGLLLADAVWSEDDGDHLTAAHRRVQMGLPLEALRLITKHRSLGGSCDNFSWAGIREALWQQISVANYDWTDERIPLPKMEDWITLATSIASVQPAFIAAELRLFDAIIHQGQQTPPRSVHNLARQREHQNKYVNLLLWTRIIPPPKGITKNSALAWLIQFVPMSRLLRSIYLESDPIHNQQVQEILGFRCVTVNIYRLLPNSALQRRATIMKTPVTGSDESNGSLVSRTALKNLLDDCLGHSLSRRVDEVVSTLQGAAFSKWYDLSTRLSILACIAMVLDDVRDITESHGLYMKQWRLLRHLLTIITRFIARGQDHSSIHLRLKLEKRDKTGLRVVRMWIRERFVALTSKTRNYATDLIILFLVSRTLNQVCEEEHVGVHPPPPLERHPGHMRIRFECFDMCHGRRPWSPHALLCFVSEILSHKWPVDVDVFCIAVEFLVEWLSILWSQRQFGSAIGTLLSRHYLLVHGIDMWATEATGGPWLEYARWIVMLLAIVLRAFPTEPEGEAGYLRKGYGKLTTEDSGPFCVRICEAMTMLGYNITDTMLREEIRLVIYSLPDHPELKTRYRQGMDWAECIALLSKRQWLVEIAPLANVTVTHIQYRAKRVTLPLGRRSTSGTPKKGFPRAPQTSPLLAQVQRIDAALSLTIRTYRVEIAAKKIQQCFRRILVLRRPVDHPALHFLVSAAFQECSREVDNIVWQERQDRHIFLGPLPHALACLDAMAMHFEFMKSQAVNRLIHAPHDELEERGSDVTSAHNLMQEAKVLRHDKLGPTCAIYNQSLRNEFYDHIRAISKLVEKLPNNVGPYIANEWKIVHRGILQKAKEKQSINQRRS